MTADERDKVIWQARKALGEALMALAPDPAEATVLGAQAYTAGFVALVHAAGGAKEAGPLIDVVNFELRRAGLQVTPVRRMPRAWLEAGR